MSAKRDQEAGLGRRGFIGAMAGLWAGAAALVAGTARPAAAQESMEERTRARYRETEHVLRFYETNRY